MAPKQSENEIPGKFLIKLPETVAGKVICIRDLAKTHLQGFTDGAKSHSVSVETPTPQALRESEVDAALVKTKEISYCHTACNLIQDKLECMMVFFFFLF